MRLPCKTQLSLLFLLQYLHRQSSPVKALVAFPSGKRSILYCLIALSMDSLIPIEPSAPHSFYVVKKKQREKSNTGRIVSGACFNITANHGQTEGFISVDTSNMHITKTVLRLTLSLCTTTERFSLKQLDISVFLREKNDDSKKEKKRA